MNRKSPPSITIAVLAPVGARDSGAAPPADPKDPAVRFMGGFIAAIDYDRKKGMP